MNKTIKLEIEPCTPKFTKKEVYALLSKIQSEMYQPCNTIMTDIFMEDQRKIEEKKHGTVTPERELYGLSFRGYEERKLKKLLPDLLTTNIAQTNQYIHKSFRQKDIRTGETSLPNFKKTMPIILHSRGFKVFRSNTGFLMEVGLLNLEKQKELGVKRFLFRAHCRDSGSLSVLNRILDGAYKRCSGQISKSKKDGKWFCSISYSFEPEKKELDPNKIMGIDLGIRNVATISIYNSTTEEYENIGYKERTIPGDELIHYRQKIEARRKKLAIASKWSSDSKVGHGYKKRNESALKIGRKYTNFRDTYNHKISRYIVDLALKYGCGTIQFEKLSGFSKEQSDSLLKNWSYFDLQNKVSYKSEEVGILVLFINPKFTSQRCHRCGYIDKGNRPTTSKFCCLSCGYTADADDNASKNISLPNIEEIIKKH